ncbi:SDR family oxidoreductase [Spongiibacter sp. KMU-158]|uniref:SDR family oxidoreductase n=1 Tax=Spongiibacter pelagi TaxID=2760804 RepID=A0A927C275_9GAMM|nr:SDR family oxidoreductase [Spongiibacter pelagi]MBD2859389.1 SDR family oxidoreductase [Spongiibacter pelagi]
MNVLNKVMIIGVTSSIAEHTARQLVGKGASLYCVARNAEKLDSIVKDLNVRAPNSNIIGAVMDIRDSQGHMKLLDDAINALGGLDAILVAHGTLPIQKDCESSWETTLVEIDTNALSVLSLLTLVGNYFEQQRRGVIAVISSVAGDRGRQSNYVYGAAKGMVSLFMQGLRNRLFKSGVSVVNIKPGFVDTPMTVGFEKTGPLWAQPDSVASGIVKAMEKGKGDVYLPWFWAVVMFVIRHIPDAIFKRLSL